MAELTKPNSKVRFYIFSVIIALIVVALFISTEFMIEIKALNGLDNFGINDYLVTIGFTLVRLLIPLILIILTKR